MFMTIPDVIQGLKPAAARVTSGFFHLSPAQVIEKHDLPPNEVGSLEAERALSHMIRHPLSRCGVRRGSCPHSACDLKSASNVTCGAWLKNGLPSENSPFSPDSYGIRVFPTSILL